MVTSIVQTSMTESSLR